MKDYLFGRVAGLLLLLLCCVDNSRAQTGMKPGEVFSGATQIEFETCDPFKEGFAVIRKGSACALIDRTGKLIVPYGKYLNIFGFSNSLCAVQTAPKDQTATSDPLPSFYGFIDKTGTLSIPCQYVEVSPFDASGKSYADRFVKINDYKMPESYPVILDKTGKETKYKKDAYSKSYSGRIVTVEGIYWAGKKVEPIDFKLEAAHPYSEGLAAVSKLDEFGNKKWGFVDIRGKVVIPFQFSNEPGDFNAGRAVVIPASNQEFDYGYINKKGEAVIKLKGDNKTLFAKGDYSRCSFAKDGIAISGVGIPAGDVVLDTLGKMLDIPGVIRTKTKIDSPIQITQLENRLMVYQVKGKYGMMSLDMRYFLPPVFEKLSLHDFESGLAYAVYRDSTGKKTEGYVNSEGVFFIVRKAASTW
jgi:hypothetical protein